MATIQMLSAAQLLLLVMGVSLSPMDSDTTSATQLTGWGAHHPQGRSATEERDKWHQCLRDQCKKVTCSECGRGPDDKGCADMCRINCECGCGGHPRGGMDLDGWQACNQELECSEKFKGCWDGCGGEQECEARCDLDHIKCSCECVQATQRKHNWDTCIVQSQCTNATCSECAPDDEDKGCADMCRMNCECGCGGHPRGGMDHDAWEACNEERDCWSDFEECRDGCEGEPECVARCELDHNKCYCGCVHTSLTITQRKHDLDTCIEQCHNQTCSKCTEADELCAKRCARRCECGCAGRSSDLSGEWEECFIGTRSCEEAHSACVKECRHDQKCRHGCDLALIECRCPCRSATEAEWMMWTQCKDEDEECGDKICPEQCGEGDTDCAHRCQRNCECRCLGISADSMDDLSVQECKIRSGCHSAHKKCQTKCKEAEGRECYHSCQLAKEKCHCKCAQTSVTQSREKERVEIIQHCNYIC